MKKIILASSVLAAALIFGGCLDKTSQPASTAPVNQGVGSDVSGSGSVPAADQKSGDTVKTGVISMAGGKFFLAEVGMSPKEVESYVVDLAEYVGQTVTVTGQYSGDTLFVGEIN